MPERGGPPISTVPKRGHAQIASLLDFQRRRIPGLFQRGAPDLNQLGINDPVSSGLTQKSNPIRSSRAFALRLSIAGMAARVVDHRAYR